MRVLVVLAFSLELLNTSCFVYHLAAEKINSELRLVPEFHGIIFAIHVMQSVVLLITRQKSCIFQARE